jgi:hypothetical protein
MNYKKFALIIFSSIILLMCIKNAMNLIEFKFDNSYSFSYNLGHITGVCIKIVGFLGILKVFYNKFFHSTKKQFIKH